MKTEYRVTTAVPARDRRRSPRLEASAEILGRLVPAGSVVRVVDISFGGFLLETDTPFEVGTLHQVRLYTLDGSADLVVSAVAVHSRRDSAAAPRSRFISGFSLAGPHQWDAHVQYDRLLDVLASSVTD
jgi:hypothetical protein